VSDLESGRATTIKSWAHRDLDNALKYYQSIGWCPTADGYLNELKALMVTFRKVNRHITEILDGFMKDKHLLVFLIIHSTFNSDARTDGDFIEVYMANKIQVSDNQVINAYTKKIPDDIAKKLSIFNPTIIPFEVLNYKVEFGCRKDLVTGKYPHDPIRVIDTTLDVDRKPNFNPEEFLSQYEDIAL